MNFFKRFYKSITDFDSYQRFFLEPVGRAIKYLITLTFVISIVFSFIFTLKYVMPAGEFLKENCPEFVYTNGFLNASESIEITDDSMYFVVDSSKLVNDSEFSSNIENNSYIFLKDGFIMKINNEKNSFLYKDILKSDFSSENIINGVNGKFYFNVYFALLFAYFIINFIRYMLYVFMITFIIYITRSMLQLKLNYSNVLAIGIYAFTLSIILDLVCILLKVFTGFNVYYYDIMLVIIGYIYTTTALYNIRKNINKLATDYAKFQKETKEEEKNKENK